MGIITDPGYRLYTGNNLCFPSGKTPKKLYLAFAGITCGPNWQDIDGDPLNGVHKMEQYSENIWIKYLSEGTIYFSTSPAGSMCYAGHVSPYNVFYFWSETGCLFTGASIWNQPDMIFYGGSFVAIPRD
jgi:hypothetical protein